MDLCKLFKDVEKLFRNPGYILQQCAYVNNLTHFSKIIENPNVTEKDLCFPEENSGNNPIMITATPIIIASHNINTWNQSIAWLIAISKCACTLITLGLFSELS